MYIDDHCSTQINQDNCEKCASYSVSFCQADENTCYSSNSNSISRSNNACPYTICRKSTLNFIYNKSNR